MRKAKVVPALWVVCAGLSSAFPQSPEVDAVKVVYTLGNAVASPGETVRIPLSLWSEKEVGLAGFAIKYDPQVVQWVRAEPVFERPDKKPWEVITFDVLEIDEGTWLHGGFLFDFYQPIALPAGVETHVLDFVFRVLPGAEVGATTLRFEDTPWPYDHFKNAVSFGPVAKLLDSAALAPATILIGATLKLTREPAFRRGDVNGDGSMDITDAVATLSYLFQGQGTAGCEDAADANDDGALDISDPIAALSHLFLGGPPLPAPAAECGHDPTEDQLSCREYPACP